MLIAGARDPEVALIDRELGGSGGAVSASLIPSGVQRTPDSAALINGVAAHVLDYDDVSLDGHPSAVLVPAILAQGEANRSSGAEMLTAYVAGFEVWGELLTLCRCTARAGTRQRCLAPLRPRPRARNYADLGPRTPRQPWRSPPRWPPAWSRIS